MLLREEQVQRSQSWKELSMLQKWLELVQTEMGKVGMK